MQRSIKNSKKFVYYNEELVTNSKFQTQLSQKLQQFRTCRKNKECSIFQDLSEYIIFSYNCKLLDWSFKGVTIEAASWEEIFFRQNDTIRGNFMHRLRTLSKLENAIFTVFSENLLGES